MLVQTYINHANYHARKFFLLRFLMASCFLISASSVLLLGMVATTVQQPTHSAHAPHQLLGSEAIEAPLKPAKNVALVGPSGKKTTSAL